MSIARTFKKTVLASAIAAILPHVAFAATITVSPSSPDQISLPDATGVVDEILFETNGQTVEKHLGANKDIDKLTVTNGLTQMIRAELAGKSFSICPPKKSILERQIMAAHGIIRVLVITSYILNPILSLQMVERKPLLA